MSLYVQSTPHSSQLALSLSYGHSRNQDGILCYGDSCVSAIDVRRAATEAPKARDEAVVLRLLQADDSGPDAEPTIEQIAPTRTPDNRSERLLLTLVFTDIVASTQTLERVGDRAWCSLLFRHHELVRAHLRAFGGREVDSAGDGFFLAFDRPGRAVQFAADIRRATRSIGIDLRVGIHTGECEVIGGRIEGVAVHIAARVAAVAAAGDILVSSTVRDLLAGSELSFSKRDLHTFKGLSEPRRLFALN